MDAGRAAGEERADQTKTDDCSRSQIISTRGSPQSPLWEISAETEPLLRYHLNVEAAIAIYPGKFFYDYRPCANALAADSFVQSA